MRPEFRRLRRSVSGEGELEWEDEVKHGHSFIGCTIPLAAVCVLWSGPRASAAMIKVTIENLAPAGGNFLTPVWVGFQDGSFDLYDLSSPAGSDLERLAEDGNAGPSPPRSGRQSPAACRA